ncbi:MAG: glycosyltransferase [Lachnospiraceae bacterium]|nr:glycosyltransferase [Lachnospiraceae bacterium]
MNVKFSVITICYNAAKVLPVTIESVLSQDYTDYEYIIQDGNSTDATPEIVNSYKEKFAERNIRFVYNREKDGGIYDAMNKAVASAGAEYINFMNAGDCFYDMHVLSHIADAEDAESSKNGTAPVIIYGDCAVYEYGRFFLFPKSLERIEESMPFSHQSVFAQSDFVREHPFNTSYRYSADYDFLLTAHDFGVKFCDSGTTVCITTADGTSSINYHDTLMESAGILKNHGKFHHSEAELLKIEKTLRIKQFVLDHFPVFIRKIIRGLQIRSRGQSYDPVIPPWFKSFL